MPTKSNPSETKVIASSWPITVMHRLVSNRGQYRVLHLVQVGNSTPHLRTMTICSSYLFTSSMISPHKVSSVLSAQSLKQTRSTITWFMLQILLIARYVTSCSDKWLYDFHFELSPQVSFRRDTSVKFEQDFRKLVCTSSFPAEFLDECNI